MAVLKSIGETDDASSSSGVVVDDGIDEELYEDLQKKVQLNARLRDLDVEALPDSHSKTVLNEPLVSSSTATSNGKGNGSITRHMKSASDITNALNHLGLTHLILNGFQI